MKILRFTSTSFTDFRLPKSSQEVFLGDFYMINLIIIHFCNTKYSNSLRSVQAIHHVQEISINQGIFGLIIAKSKQYYTSFYYLLNSSQN